MKKKRRQREEEQEPQSLELKKADLEPEKVDIPWGEDSVPEQYTPSTGVTKEVIGFTGDTNKTYQPLPPNLTKIKVEEEAHKMKNAELDTVFVKEAGSSVAKVVESTAKETMAEAGRQEFLEQLKGDQDKLDIGQ